VKATEIAAWRLHTLGVTAPRFGSAAEVVGWLGAVQAQEFAPAKWAIGARTATLREADVQAAYDDGEILRTHVLRPTWHFATRDDVRLLLHVTGPRVGAGNASRYRALGLDDFVLERTAALMADAVRGGRHLTRSQLGEVLVAEGIPVDGQRLAHIVMHAELTAVLCSGAMAGRQHTYALFDERAPAQKWDKEEAAAALVLRYFTSHGPATVKDLQAWASLTATTVRAGLAMARDRLQHMEADGLTYWFAGDPPPLAEPSGVRLLQMYDEYVMGYRESRGVLDVDRIAGVVPLTGPSFHGAVVAGTQVVGRWRRRSARSGGVVEVAAARPLDGPTRVALAEETARYAGFLGEDLQVVEI
jgi:hypothetical protein